MEITFNQLLDACTETFGNDDNYDSWLAIRLFAALHDSRTSFSFLQEYGYTFVQIEYQDYAYMEAYEDANGHRIWAIFDFEDNEFILEDEEAELCSDTDYDDFCEGIDRILS